VSAFAEEEDLSREQLNMIKAKTMYNMVEEIDGSKKLLFLTTDQACEIASSNRSLQKMLDALDIGKSQLVINLLPSNGSGEWLRTVRPPHVLHMVAGGERILNWAAGCVGSRSPFLAERVESAAQSRLDLFMSDVLIPLAAQINAIVLASGLRTECMLTDSFTRMYYVQKSQWGHKPPFTIISYTSDIR